MMRKAHASAPFHVLAGLPNPVALRVTMSYKMTTQKLVSMSVAALTGASLCALFAMVLFMAGGLAA